MKTKRYLQAFLLACCLLITSCMQVILVNADEQVVSLDIELEDDGTPMEGVVFSMYRVTDDIVPPNQGDELRFMPDFENCGYSTAVKTARELVALSRRLEIWIKEHKVEPTYVLATDENGYCGIQGLPFGMYLIVPSEFDEYGPVVTSLVFLPGRDENGDLLYHNRIVPKHSIPEEDNPDGPTTPAQGETTTPEESTRETDEESTPEETTAPHESTTPEESTRQSEEESTPYEPTGPEAPTTPTTSEEESNPDQPTTPASPTSPTTPSSTTPSTPDTPPSPRRILGIEDPTGRIGMMMVTAGVGLLAIAIVLIVRRELKNK